MNKNTRTLLITLISFVVVIVIATVAYNTLKNEAPSVSFVPNMVLPDLPPTAEQQVASEDIVVKEEVQSEEPLREEEQAEEPAEDDGSVMPDIPLFYLDGTETSFNTVRDGKPAIINYFASWCPPCKLELPHFQKAYEDFGDQISFIFLDAIDGQRETLKTIETFIKTFPFTGPVYYDQGLFAAIFQTNSLPTTVFFDKAGRVVKGYLGFVPEEVLLADIAELLD